MKYLKIIILFSIILSSCSEDVLTEEPRDIISADNLYVDLEGFEAGINGLYTYFRQERGGNFLGSYNGLLISPAITGTDNMYANFRNAFGNVANDYTRSQSTASYFRDLFIWVYGTINAASTIIERAENPDIHWTQEEKNSIVAQARLIRAWAYRHATYLWGDMPLVLEESQGSNIRTDYERTPVAEIRAQMEQDWLFAEANLPELNPIDGRLSKGVATHYLAELYLATDQPGKARQKAESLINNGPYQLVTERYGVKANQPGTPYSDMFLDGNSNRSEGNTEALWVMQHQIDELGGGANIMRRWIHNRADRFRAGGVSGSIRVSVENGGRGLGRIGITRFGLELYENGDHRGGVFGFRSYGVLNNPDRLPEGRQIGDTIFYDYQGQDEKINNAEWPSTRKWDYADSENLAGAPSYNDQVYLRLAETYFLLAEAQFKLGDLGGAATTINALRIRANVSEISAADVDIDFILDERSRELFSEEHRRYTLVRLNKLVERVQLHNAIGGPTITDRDIVFPIPQDVIDANITREFPQNPGYSQSQ